MDLTLIVLISGGIYLAVGTLLAGIFGRFVRKTDERASTLLRKKERERQQAEAGKRAS